MPYWNYKNQVLKVSYLSLITLLRGVKDTLTVSQKSNFRFEYLREIETISRILQPVNQGHRWVSLAIKWVVGGVKIS